MQRARGGGWFSAIGDAGGYGKAVGGGCRNVRFQLYVEPSASIAIRSIDPFKGGPCQHFDQYD